MSNKIIFESIGNIESNYKDRSDTPTQGMETTDSRGVIVMRDEFEEGVRGLNVGDDIKVLFQFHKSKDYKMTIVPFRENTPTGVFCTRSPDRPNGIGITVVKITEIEGKRITFLGADMIDGSPIIDIKPSI
jgi:tRNA-Thr(GGU) m(6)t(6)A37 methyltransferase TsaA